MPRVHVVEQTNTSPESILAAARDFSEQRADLWPDVHTEHREIHDSGDTWAVVTEGNPWPIGFVWERLRYDWSEPGAVKGVVVDSNIFKPGSTWEIHASPTDEGGSLVEIVAVRHIRGLKGYSLAPFFPVGLARRTVAEHLRHFLAQVEERDRGGRVAS